MVCQRLMLTAFRYPNLSEVTNGQKEGNNILLDLAVLTSSGFTSLNIITE